MATAALTASGRTNGTTPTRNAFSSPMLVTAASCNQPMQIDDRDHRRRRAGVGEQLLHPTTFEGLPDPGARRRREREADHVAAGGPENHSEPGRPQSEHRDSGRSQDEVDSERDGRPLP